jgi:hypothetical protein
MVEKTVQERAVGAVVDAMKAVKAPEDTPE